MITKAIVPVAGWGTRRLPITKVIEKSMLPVGDRPLVDYAVQELIKAGVTALAELYRRQALHRGICTTNGRHRLHRKDDNSGDYGLRRHS